MRITGSVAPDGKDAALVEYHFDVEVSALPLRDLFAAFALAGLIANQGNPVAIGAAWIAAESYAAADAMLAQTEERVS